MNQSVAETAFNAIDQMAIDLYGVYYYVSVVCLFMWFVLSSIWLFILILKYFSDRKCFKLQWKSRNCMRNETRISLLKNYAFKQTNNKLLILLCGVEIVASLIVIIMCYGNVSMSYIDKDITVRFLQPISDTDSLTDRLIASSIISVIIIIYDIVSLINVCLIERYTYYPSQCKHPVRYGLTRLGLKLGIILVLSFAVQLTLFKGLFINFTLVYEYIRLVKLTRKLVSLLYKRYFDARTHEYQSATVVAIYKRVYWEYRIGSALLLTALFFQLFAILIDWVYAVILTLLCNTQWLQQVYSIPIQVEYIVDWNNWALRSADRVVDTISGVSTALGFFLLAVPYSVVTCNYVYRAIVRLRAGNIGYSRHSLGNRIYEMIEEHNSAYAQNRC